MSATLCPSELDRRRFLGHAQDCRALSGLGGNRYEQIFQAGNGAEALALLKDNPVDLILCDINMPVMHGTEFIKQLPGVGNAKDVPVV